MVNPYEMFVKEFLEQYGFIVAANVRFKKEKGWSDIDIVAIKIENNNQIRALVGEVKPHTPNLKELREVNEALEHESLKKKLLEDFGIRNYYKCFFCWSAPNELKEQAREIELHLITFMDMLKALLMKLKPYFHGEGRYIYDTEHPYIMLLQMLMFALDRRYLTLEHFTNPCFGVLMKEEKENCKSCEKAKECRNEKLNLLEVFHDLLGP